MRIAIVGYGRMGRAVEKLALERGHEIAARLDRDEPGGAAPTPERLEGAEVAVEFTEPEAAPGNIERLAGCGVDAVVGTTGWYEHVERARRAVDAAGTGLIYAPNFSLGVQLFLRIAELAARLADRVGTYDVFVQEAHHRHKRDHPSGTAARLADLLVANLSAKTTWALGTGAGPIEPSVLQVTSVRAGEIAGTHSVGLDGAHDQIEIRHEAKGRTGFALGALAAAEWVRGRKGVFTLDDMLDDLWS